MQNRAGQQGQGAWEVEQTVRNIDKELQDEMVKQLTIVYPAAAIALWEMGWRQQRILGVIKETQDLWNTCAADPMTSMLMMLEDETGIEIRARGVSASYHDLEYLNGKVDPHPMTKAQYQYMRIRQKPWVNPQITAALLLALHRKYGWSGVRDQRLLEQKDQIEAQYKWNPNKLLKACKELTGINIYEEVTTC